MVDTSISAFLLSDYHYDGTIVVIMQRKWKEEAGGGDENTILFGS